MDKIEILVERKPKTFDINLLKQSDNAFGENGYITVIASKDKNTVVYSDIHKDTIYICKKVGSEWIRTPLYMNHEINKGEVFSGTGMSISDDSGTIAIISRSSTCSKVYLCILKHTDNGYVVFDIKEHFGHSSSCVIFNGDKNIFLDLHNSFSTSDPSILVHPCPVYELSEKGNYTEISQLLINKLEGTRLNNVAFSIKDNIITLKAHRVVVNSQAEMVERSTSIVEGKPIDRYYQYKFKRDFLLWEEFK